MSKVTIVAGPTASGKSAHALNLAVRTQGVVVNADSMQVYDALPILTARPAPEDERAAPHVLYGILPPGDDCSAARWVQMANAEINKALQAGLYPIVTGGTGFYIRALTHGLSPMPDVPPAIRQAMAHLQKDMGNRAFHDLLRERDPVMAEKIGPGDTQRMIRSMEVLEATGKSLSYWQSLPPQKPDWDFEITLIDPPREELHERIDRRFDTMMDAGALDETAHFDALIQQGRVPENAGITHAHGFRPLRDHLHGKITLDEAIALSKIETRQYAKRQVTWFRHQIISTIILRSTK